VKKNLILILLTISFLGLQAQTDSTQTPTKKSFFKKVSRKGKLYVYWGWNRSTYTPSDITFTGTGYDFTLSDVKAYDRQSDFSVNLYFNPATATIPQYQYRFGYYINDHYNISWGFNHMKYVMSNEQSAKINGTINTGGQYDGEYNGEEIPLESDFLAFEHTDGLNYLSFNFERIDAFWVSKNGKYNLNFVEGVGLGAMFPKSNVSLMGESRDEWHVAGYGLSALIAIRFDFLKNFFVQGQLEGGFINMPDIITTGVDGARAKQNFFFLERMIMFGGYIPLVKQK
jgi:hypothetical protein